jgi:hypothetical protein
MSDETLRRLKAVDWSNKPEAKISSELITPVLHLLGYGEHTLHKVGEQRSYALRDPYTSKGSRRVRLDYEPSVHEEGLWVMEAKGSDTEVSPATLGQVRDYAIHPEVRAALMVTVDSAGFRVFDPWDEHWDEALLTIGLSEAADRIDELRAVLGVDQVANVIRQRHFEHLRRALSASLEFDDLANADREFRELLQQARGAIDAKRREIYRQARQDADSLHDRVVRDSGVLGVAQSQNSPWIGSLAGVRDFATAVMARDQTQRRTEFLKVRPAIEAVYRERVAEGSSAWRPLWWLHIVLLGGSLRLRGKAGCEPIATDAARRSIRDCLLEFPDDDVAAASWRLQRVTIPWAARKTSTAPLEEITAEARARLTPVERIQFQIDPARLFMWATKSAVVGSLAKVEPWEPRILDGFRQAIEHDLASAPTPTREWPGPMGDPWLRSWDRASPLLTSALAVLLEHPDGDDLLADDELRDVIRDSAASDQELIRRSAVPLARRLGLRG